MRRIEMFPILPVPVSYLLHPRWAFGWLELHIELWLQIGVVPSGVVHVEVVLVAGVEIIVVHVQHSQAWRCCMYASRSPTAALTRSIVLPPNPC